MRSCSVLLRHEPLSGNDRTTLGVFHQEFSLKVLVDTWKLLGFSSFAILAFAVLAFAKLAFAKLAFAILAASMATFTKLTASMVIFATFAASLVNSRPTWRISGSLSKQPL